MVKIFIVEDEKSIREELILLLKQRNDVEIIGETSSIKESVAFLSLHSPDLVLMDIQLEDGLSFSIFEQLEIINFGTIFITAFDSYALKAIKLSAFDYLLKPIDPKELEEAINKFNSKAQYFAPHKKQSDYLVEIQSNDSEDKIIVKTLEKTYIVKQKEIIVCKGEGNYTTFFTQNNDKIISSKPLKYYRELLTKDFFIQPHQSFLVNKNFIDSIDSSNQLVLTHDLFPVPISIRRKKEVLKKIYQ